MILRNETDFFADLYCLRAAFRAKLVEEPAGVSLDGVLADEKLAGDLAVAQTLGDEFEDLEFTFGDAELSLLVFVDGERPRHRNGDFPDDFDFLQEHDLFFAREFESEPDADGGEEGGNQSAIDFDRVLDDNEAKLDQSQQYDQRA